MHRDTSTTAWKPHGKDTTVVTSRTSALRDPDILGRRAIGMVLIAILAASILSFAPGFNIRAAAQNADATPVAATPVPANSCDRVAPGVEAEPWIRTELYFGTMQPDGTDVTPGEWQQFLDEEITPRFPDGLTILEGYGQFLDEEGVVLAEESVVLIVFYPANDLAASSTHFEEIRDAYEEQFDQEAVLRVDSQPVCVSF